MKLNISEPQLTYDDVLIVPQHSELESRQDCDFMTEFGGWRLSPIMISNMKAVSTLSMMQELESYSIIVPAHRFQSIEDEYKITHCMKHDQKYVPVCGSVGLNEPDRTDAVLQVCDWIFLELAHADTKRTIDEVKFIKSRLTEDQKLIAGNVCTPQACERLFNAGADVVKCGQGPGAVCTTRIVTGTGYPQFSAVVKCAQVGPIIADGGIKTSGDIVKALAAGAQFVMIGSLFAGTDEAAGKRIKGSGQKAYYGSASQMNGYVGSNNTPEGVDSIVPYVGSASEVAQELHAGIRQGMAMIGARDLKELRARAEFIRVTPAGAYEGSPHILGRK